MNLPKKSTKVLCFKHNDTWYQITSEGEIYVVYRCEEDGYTLLGTGNSPVKLENKVYDGKLK